MSTVRRAPKTIQSRGARSARGTLCIACLAGAVFLSVTATRAMAEDSAVLNIDETGEALVQTESALDESRRATAKLGVQVTEIKLEVLRLRRELVDGAAAAQDMEARISTLEANLEGLTERRVEKRQALSRRRDELTQTFAALQRVSRTPPDLLIFMPASVQDISHARLLLGAVAGELDARAAMLGEELQELARLGEQISAQHELIDYEAERLEAQRVRLGVLLARKTMVHNRTEDQRVRAEALVTHLAEEAETLQELLGRLEQERFTRPEREIELIQVPVLVPAPAEIAQTEAPQAEPAQSVSPPVASVRSVTLSLAPTTTTTPTPPLSKTPTRDPADEERPAPEVVVAPSLDTPPAPAGDQDNDDADSVDIGPVAALVPARPTVSAARGAFAMPARGQLISRFDESTALGLSTKGIVIETRARAQIVAPFDGRIAFAGPFREYGLLLIIDHGEGYHTLLAGMGQIDVLLDQHVLAGEPVGVMGSPGDEKPQLYVELRKRGHPINPLPWLAAESIKVSG